MKFKWPFFLFAVALSLPTFSIPARADWQIADDEAEAGGFDLSAQIGAGGAKFLLARDQNGAAYRLSVSPQAVELSLFSGGKIRAIGTAKLAPASLPAPLVLQKRQARFTVLLGGKTVFRAEDDTLQSGEIAYDGAISNLKIQPVEPIVFDDDFMRVASDVALKDALRNPRAGVKIKDAALSETIWSGLVGRWATTGLTENTEAQVAQSANPFAFRALDKGPNLSVAGQPFWSDLSYSVAAQPQGAREIGVLCAVQDAKNYLGFFWKEERAPELRAVVNGVPRVLARAKNFEGLEQNQWARLEIRFGGGTLVGLLDDAEVCRAQTGLWGRGQIGLFADLPQAGDDKKGVGAVFDDAKVRALRDLGDDFSTPIAGRWKPIAGKWSFTGRAQNVGAPGAYAAMGETGWRDAKVSARLEIPSGGAAGLLLHHQSGKGAYLLRVGGTNSKVAAGKVELARLQGGKTTVLASKSFGSRFNGSNSRWILENERGYLSAKIAEGEGETLVLDAFDEALGGGRAGVFAQGGAIRDFRVEFPQSVSRWAKVPALYEVEQQAQTMGGWSTPEGFWVKNEGGALEHKGEFWGDGEVRFPLPKFAVGQNATLGWGAQNVVFNANSVKIGAQSASLAGVKEGDPIIVERRGTFLIVRSGEKTLLAARM